MAKKFEEIKEEEYPYELPEGWKWERLGNIADVVMGQSPSGNDITDDSTFTPLIGGAADMGEVYPKVKRYTKKITKISQNNDIILCIRATLGRPIFSNGEYCLGRGVASIRPSDEIYKNFLLNMYKNFEQYLYDNATGSTFLQVTGKVLCQMPIPLPPKETQQKIVDIIESLFAKLDIAQEKVEQVLAESENRRSAILHNAFSGKLTEKWRKENNVSFDSWKECKFGDICKFIGGGTPRKDNDEYWNGNINWASIKDIKGKYLNSTTDFITEKGLNNSSANLCSIGELIIGTRINPGKPIISNIETAINQDLKIVKSKLNTEFLYYLFTVNNKKIESLSSGSTVLGIGLKILNNIEIDIPKEEEQKEIVRLLDKFLSVEDKVKSTCQNTLEAIATMRKSILAKAFRGELCS
ncbi:MAG: restriction endonuclease subunit S [Selenomonadaceae bacterium]|nr:restriction endonuclease subunit S [Selenomonadaceae bacterium]